MVNVAVWAEVLARVQGSEDWKGKQQSSLDFRTKLCLDRELLGRIPWEAATKEEVP